MQGMMMGQAMRKGSKVMYKILVTDKNHELCGQILDGAMIYCDIRHTGNSEDLYQVHKANGDTAQLLSTQVDVEFYEEQLLAEEMKRLGANIGDIVTIQETGGGSYKCGWKKEGLHTITDVSCLGYVTFDDGMAHCFRPIVTVAR